MDRSIGIKVGSVAFGLLGFLVVLSFMGTQTSTILSTVGAPIDNPGPPAGSTGDDDVPAGDVSADDGAGRTTAALDAVLAARQLVFTGSLGLEVVDLPAAVRAGDALVKRHGGYIGGSQMSADGDATVASITYRIPADRWDEALAAFRELGTVVAEETDAADVATEIIDVEARIRNLRASETALQGIAAKATAIRDVLEVEKRLGDVREQIERLDARRTALADQIAFGTLAVTYGREVVAVVEVATGWDPNNEVDRASATLVGVIQAVTSAGIWFGIVWLPILIALAVVVAVLRFVLARTGLLGAARRTMFEA